jgi:hypothetical protein
MSPKSKILGAGFSIKKSVVEYKNNSTKKRYVREKSFASILEKDQKANFLANGSPRGGHSFSKNRKQKFLIESEN